MEKLKMLLCLGILLAIASCTHSLVNAADYTDEQIVNAIYKAEGGLKASKPYGIMRAECTWDNERWCRLACLQTVKNNRKRYTDYGHIQFDSYLEFLASRYAPIGAANDPQGLNKNWLKNVKYFLDNG